MTQYQNGELQNVVGEKEGSRTEENGGNEVILGVDGGATSTVCVCLPLLPFSDSNLPDPLPIIARAVAGCSNHNSIGEAEAREALEHVIDEALSKAGSNRAVVRALCLAVSGVNHPKDQERILNWMRKMFSDLVQLFVFNDAVAALASGTMGKLHGCVLISGTGSISYGITEDGKEARAGGGGPILGDWGSGYGIAAQALTAVLRAQDGRGSGTTLSYNSSWARIAALAPVVVSCAESGDEIANKILVEAVQGLAVCVKSVVQRLHLCGEDKNGSFPVVFVGGILQANVKWDIAKETINCIRREYPGAYSIRPQVEPAVGAALLALNLFAQGVIRKKRLCSATSSQGPSFNS